MAASGVAVMTSKTSSEDEEDDASLWRKTLPAARSSAVARGGSEALVAALRREKAMGENERVTGWG
jgi:hypothetical protein